MKLSICIPTFNRATSLENCLYSIANSKKVDFNSIEVCISDNHSTDDTPLVVEKFTEKFADLISIKYQRNDKNLGIPRNFLNVVKLGSGEFCWLVGDDDLITPYGLYEILGLINENKLVDFFFVNSFQLSHDYIRSYDHPFDTDNLPEDMSRSSKWRYEGIMNFNELIDPRKSFDFLGGMFLSVFRRENWQRYSQTLNPGALTDPRTFSHFDNTFPHVKIFAQAFREAKAFFNAKPPIVCLSGIREWTAKSELVTSIRLVEALEVYRNNGLGFLRYYRCRNYALRFFLPHFIKMLIRSKTSGVSYFNPVKVLLANLIYPNTYFSIFYYAIEKGKHVLARQNAG